MFNPNSIPLYLSVAIVIVFLIIQSLYFIIKAWKRGIQIGISAEKLKKTVLSSAVFTIAPAIAILLGVIALSKSLGLPIPWLRLSVIGSLTYETSAAATAAAAANTSLSDLISDPQVFSTIFWVMTIGSVFALVLVTVLSKKIQSGVTKIKSKDKKWGEIFLTSLFLGMISAFLGMIFATVNEGIHGWIPVFVMLISSAIMAVCGLIYKKFNVKWMEDYALPISMLSSMLLAIPITNALV